MANYYYYYLHKIILQYIDIISGRNTNNNNK